MTRALHAVRPARFVIRRQEGDGYSAGDCRYESGRQWWVQIVGPTGKILASTELYKRRSSALRVCELINPALKIEERV